MDKSIWKDMRDNLGSRATYNPHFESDNFEIINGFVKRQDKDLMYERRASADLLRKAIKHKYAHNKVTSAENVLVLVHPFYLNMTMPQFLNEHSSKDALKYLNNLERTLSERNPDKLSVIAFDMPHHYAAITSLLLESGHIDDVYFTKRNQGFLLNEDEIDPIIEETFYMAGGFVGSGFNQQCLNQASETILKRKKGRINDREIYTVNGLVVKSPAYHSYIMNRKEILVLPEGEPHIIKNISMAEFRRRFKK